MYCNYCGKETEPNAVFCNHCGAHISVAAAPDLTTQEPAPAMPELPPEPTAAPPTPPPVQEPVYQPYQAYQQAYQPYPPPVAPAPKKNGLAIAAMICGICGFFCYGIPGIVGLILGLVAKKKIKQNGEGGSGFATAGIVCGAIAIALWALVITAIVLGITWTANNTPYMPSPPSHWLDGIYGIDPLLSFVRTVLF